MNTVLQTVVIVFGIAICVMCAAGIFSPDGLIRIVKRVWDKKGGIYAAVIVRLLLGAVLILVAADSRFPTFFTVLGAIAVLAAVAIPFIGRERTGRLIAMFEDFSPWLLRVWLLFGIAFGGLLIYGVW